jgi:hypothetical protein
MMGRPGVFVNLWPQRATATGGAETAWQLDLVRQYLSRLCHRVVAGEVRDGFRTVPAG